MSETKYGKHVLRHAFKTHHQLEGLSANGDEMDAECILTHHVIYKPEVMLKEPHYHSDFHQLLCFLGTNPMDVRDFGGATVEICLGKEQEKHVIDSPAIVSVSPGLPHGPQAKPHRFSFGNRRRKVLRSRLQLYRRLHRGCALPTGGAGTRRVPPRSGYRDRWNGWLRSG